MKYSLVGVLGATAILAMVGQSGKPVAAPSNTLIGTPNVVSFGTNPKMLTRGRTPDPSGRDTPYCLIL